MRIYAMLLGEARRSAKAAADDGRKSVLVGRITPKRTAARSKLRRQE